MAARASSASSFREQCLPPVRYEAESVPEGTQPLLRKAIDAGVQTVLFAAAAVGLSIVVGLGLGFLGSTAWWAGDPVGASGAFRKLLRQTVAPTIYAATRVLIALMRSIHELIWAVLFLSAMGLTNLAAAIAIAIPYSGTLAKVFSEMIDEAPRDAATALRAAGASPLQVFFVGLLPQGRARHFIVRPLPVRVWPPFFHRARFLRHSDAGLLHQAFLRECSLPRGVDVPLHAVRAGLRL